MPAVSEKPRSPLPRRSRQVQKEEPSVAMQRAREEWKSLPDDEKTRRREAMRRVIGDVGSMGP